VIPPSMPCAMYQADPVADTKKTATSAQKACAIVRRRAATGVAR
jgi:hypothetical protein